jgi:PD-(D/E)XK nuclease superfamily
MTPSAQQLTSILAAVKRVNDRDADLRRLRGENFNLFSILGLETAENKTHSAFLGALLDPRGSHGLGEALLQAFLDTVGYKGRLQAAKARITLEKHVGFRDDDAKTGGRIDIFLHDGIHSIAIENKLYAGDQYAQLERYAKYNPGHAHGGSTTVYYLNLDGSAPSAESKGELEANQGYHPITYRDDILNWLTACMRLATDQPILRESIKQYLHLIQKLTGQMSDSKMNTEIHDLIAREYTAAKLLADHIWAVESNAVQAFMTDLKAAIDVVLPEKDGWEVTIDPELRATYSGIRITHTEWGGIVIRLQGETQLIGGGSIYLISAYEGTWDRNIVMERLKTISDWLHDTRQSPHCPAWKWVNLFQTTEDNARLFDTEARASLLKTVSDELIFLAKACREPLARIPRIPGA